MSESGESLPVFQRLGNCLCHPLEPVLLLFVRERPAIRLSEHPTRYLEMKAPASGPMSF